MYWWIALTVLTGLVGIFYAVRMYSKETRAWIQQASAAAEQQKAFRPVVDQRLYTTEEIFAMTPDQLVLAACGPGATFLVSPGEAAVCVARWAAWQLSRKEDS